MRASQAYVLVAVIAAGIVIAVPPYRCDAAGAACGVRVGQRIALASMSSDPDVFIFDSRARLIDYQAGHFNDVRSVMAHTVLAKPGTFAVVAMCSYGAVKPSYSAQNYDAVGIKITSGPYRSRWGWVSSEDVHVVVLENLRVLSSRNTGKTHTGAGGSKRP